MFGCETYLKEAFSDSARWKEVMRNVGVWTVSIDTALVDKYLAAKAPRAAGNPEKTPE